MFQYLRLSASLPYRLQSEFGQFVVHCHLLKASGHGRTEQAARKHLKDTIALKIEIWIERRELESNLREYGFLPMRLGGHQYWAAKVKEEGELRLEMKARLRVKEGAVNTAPLTGQEQQLDFPWYINLKKKRL